MNLRSWREHPEGWSAFVVIVVALAASATSLGNGFTFDDVPIIVESHMVQQLQSLWDYLTTSYWGPSRGNALYRPLTVGALALQRAAGAGDPASFHAMSIALYVATSLAVLVLARALLPAGAALLAAAVWASHPVHVEAVGNVVGQSEMLAGIPMLLGVVYYIRARTIGALSRRTIAGIVALFATALAAKEHGILLPGLLVAAELAFRRRRFRSDSASDASLVLLAKLLLLTVVLYFMVRYAVLPDVLGDYPHVAIEALSTTQRLFVVLGLLPDVARLLLWPAQLHPDYSPSAVPVLSSPAPWHLLGLLVLAVYCAALIAAWRRDREGTVLFALLCLPVTYSLVSNVLFPSGVLIAERTLFLPSLTVALLAGSAQVGLAPWFARRASAFTHAAVTLGVAAAIGLATVHSANRQLVWKDNITLFVTMAVESPKNFKAHFALGELFGARGAWPQAEHHLRIADSLFPGYDLIHLSLARALHLSNRCDAALPYYDSVLKGRPDVDLAIVGRTACLLELRRLSDARKESIRGLGQASSANSVYRILLAHAESSLVANDTVDARNRWWRAGRPTSKSDARLRVPVVLLQPGQAIRSGIMPESSPDSLQ